MRGPEGIRPKRQPAQRRIGHGGHLPGIRNGKQDAACEEESAYTGCFNLGRLQL